LRASASSPPDIVVLDLGLPDVDGVEVVRGLRGWSAAPIVILSGRSQSAAKVEALDAGADDYVTKPFSIDELLARLRAVGRRVGGSDDRPRVMVGEYEVDLQARRVVPVVTAEGDVRLTPTEWQVLEMLVRNPGKLITQRDLLLAVRGPSLTEDAHYLRQYMTQLRRKLEPDPARPRYLLTEPGMGYRFQP
jgi:two-component system KDP operon response regulator KdpE